MMHTVVLWLFCGASLALFSQAYLADGAPLQVMAAPNLLRVGTPENIFVECQDCSGGPQNVEIVIIKHPTRSHKLASTNVTIDSGNNFQAMGQITIPATEMNKDPNLKQYVFLQAHFPGRLLEKVVMVSFQSGHIFIQTDKTIYKPGSKVNYRMFSVNPSMEPIIDYTSITVEVVNPDGIVLILDRFATNSGIYSANYDLPGIDRSSSSVGVWKLVARFSSIPQQSYSAEFEVKEYVLPSFEVKLFPERSCFYMDNDQLHVDIKARYLSGREVQGTAHVVFGVIDQQDQKKSFPSSLQRVQVVGGLGRATLERRNITHAFPDSSDLVKSHIYVSASVLTGSGSEMVKAEVRDIQIVTSPYTIHLKKTSKYFKPGMASEVVITVMNCDGTPAAGVAVVVEPGHLLAVTANNGIAKVLINTMAGASHLDITAKTVDEKIRVDRQASVSMRAIAYTSTTNNYLHITADSSGSGLGSNIRINIALGRNAPQNLDITYLILSRGQLVKAGRYRRQGHALISLHLLITKDMLPSFRMVAYYHTGTSEVVSDSTWVEVEVEDTCMGSNFSSEPSVSDVMDTGLTYFLPGLHVFSLTLESTTGPWLSPRRRFGLKVTGDPGATVGLVAVDKAVHVLNNKHQLTQKKVWDIVDKHDTGCTAGGGEDSMGVFYDAGLLFETSTASGTPYRQELRCAVSMRRKRSLTILDVKTTLGRRYSDETQRQCCVDGMKDSSVSRDCQRGSHTHYVGEDQACVEAFMQCCTELASQQSDMKKEHLYPARRKRNLDDDHDEVYTDSDEIIARTQQPESWLWNDVRLPNCPANNANCKTTSSVLNRLLPDSMTTWQVTGISLSKTHGLCVSDPLEIMVRKPFFIDLRLPYVAVQGEQLQVKAVLHNSSPESVRVRVDLIDSSDRVCSLASKQGKYRHVVDVEPYSTRSLPFVIRPLNAVWHPVEVKASVKDLPLSDGIRENLQVLPEGDLMKESKHVKLEPAKHGGVHELSLVSSVIPDKGLIPGAPVTTMFLLTGQRPFKDHVVSGSSMGGLIRQTSSSTDGEHNMLSMALTVSTATYLDKTNAWEDVGFGKREEALRHIRTGYTNQLAFRRTNGCFAMSQQHACSTWLTAFVVKVLAMADKLMNVQGKLICDSVKWLILHKQVTGSFVETGRVNNREMAGDVFGVDSDASITAFTLVAMQQARHMCAAITSSMPDSIDRAVGYLERRLPSLTNPYAVAITSYALATENKLNKEILYKFASTDASHWPVSSDVYTLETTAYSLLALVEVKAFDKAEPVVRWLNKQRRNFDGGYGSTQATMLVYQALSQYWTTELKYDLDVTVSMTHKINPYMYNFNDDNFYASRTFSIRGINQRLQVTARGSGEATLTVMSFYFKEKRNELSAQFSECGRPQYGISEPGDIERIIGGKTSLPGTHPWQASLQRRPTGSPEPFKHVCGGSLIASCWVLTAAHCINDSMDMRVVLGGVDVIRDEPEYDQVIPVERVIVHEDYRVSYSNGRPSALHNDVALLQLRVMDSPLCAKESRYVKTACLPKQRFPDGMVSCVISGWGITVPVMSMHQVPPWYRPSKLLDAQVPLLPKHSCMAPHVYGDRLDKTMICAGYLTGEVDACQGDSGGPLVCEQTGTHYITGVVSFGDGCAQRNKPGVYANVHRYVDWITEIMSNPNRRNSDSQPLDYNY